MKIGFLTTTRADYGKLKPLMAAGLTNGDRVSCFVLGMHLSQEFGSTYLEVGNGLDVEVFLGKYCESSDHLEILSHCIVECRKLLESHRPDLIVIHGDRIEPLAMSVAARYLSVKAVHIEAGEKSGTLDNTYRDVISDFCDFHLVCSLNALERMSRRGSVHVELLGSPELDEHLNPSTSFEECADRYGVFKTEEFGIILFHPDTENSATDGRWAILIRDMVLLSKRNWVVIGSNNDPNYDEIRQIFAESFYNTSHVRVVNSMRSTHFAAALRKCSVVVGNSSLGVREAPFLGKPSINVGLRQAGRHSSESISDLQDLVDVEEFLNMVSMEWGKSYSADRTFGEGDSAARFTRWLEGFRDSVSDSPSVVLDDE